MSAPFTDEELDMQLAQRLAARGWAVVPPGKDKSVQPPPAKAASHPPAHVVSLFAHVPFHVAIDLGGFEPNEKALTDWAKGVHVQMFFGAGNLIGDTTQAMWDRFAQWRGWKKDNVREVFTALTILPFVSEFDPTKHAWEQGFSREMNYPEIVSAAKVPGWTNNAGQSLVGGISPAVFAKLQETISTLPNWAKNLPSYDEVLPEQAKLNRARATAARIGADLEREGREQNALERYQRVRSQSQAQLHDPGMFSDKRRET